MEAAKSTSWLKQIYREMSVDQGKWYFAYWMYNEGASKKACFVQFFLFSCTDIWSGRSQCPQMTVMGTT